MGVSLVIFDSAILVAALGSSSCALAGTDVLEPIMADSITDLIRLVLSRYNQEKQTSGGLKNAAHPVKMALAKLEELLQASEPVRRASADVRRHVGTKQWRAVPLLEIGGTAARKISDEELAVCLLFAIALTS